LFVQEYFGVTKVTKSISCEIKFTQLFVMLAYLLLFYYESKIRIQ